MKSTSRFAIAAAASVFATGAYAADLGGNCCTDLEERVAELEATAARKGNRKVSLTVFGQVNEAVIFWDDGVERNHYIVTNDLGRTRFGFRGDAKIDAEWSAGYLLEIGVRSVHSGQVNQFNDDAGQGLDLRHSAWWIENKRLGRVWLGQTGSATDGITLINLANTAVVAVNDPKATVPVGFYLRNPNGTLANNTWGSILSSWNGNTGEGGRRNVLRYISPTLHGFTFSAARGEDDFKDFALRYANEFNGVRVAFGIGYQWFGDREAGCQRSFTFTGSSTVPGGPTDVDCKAVGMSGSIMHVPTGLFVSSSYGFIEDDHRKKYLGAGAKTKDKHWYIVGGVERKFFALGKTTLYGEYGSYDTGTNGTTVNAAVAPYLTTVQGFNAGNVMVSSDVELWGLGIVQTIDAAAMDLYLGFRKLSGSANWYPGATVPAGANGRTVDIQDFSMVTMGGIIRF